MGSGFSFQSFCEKQKRLFTTILNASYVIDHAMTNHIGFGLMSVSEVFSPDCSGNPLSLIRDKDCNEKQERTLLLAQLEICSKKKTELK